MVVSGISLVVVGGGIGCGDGVFVVSDLFECLGMRASSGSVEVGVLPEDSPAWGWRMTDIELAKILEDESAKIGVILPRQLCQEHMMIPYEPVSETIEIYLDRVEEEQLTPDDALWYAFSLGFRVGQVERDTGQKISLPDEAKGSYGDF